MFVISQPGLKKFPGAKVMRPTRAALTPSSCHIFFARLMTCIKRFLSQMTVTSGGAALQQS